MYIYSYLCAYWFSISTVKYISTYILIYLCFRRATRYETLAIKKRRDERREKMKKVASWHEFVELNNKRKTAVNSLHFYFVVISSYLFL